MRAQHSQVFLLFWKGSGYLSKYFTFREETGDLVTRAWDNPGEWRVIFILEKNLEKMKTKSKRLLHTFWESKKNK